MSQELRETEALRRQRAQEVDRALGEVQEAEARVRELQGELARLRQQRGAPPLQAYPAASL